MYKILMRHSLLLLCSLFCVCGLIIFQTHQAKAASTPTVTIVKPTVNGAGVGHPGAATEISGSGFPAGQVSLFTTTNNDPKKCMPGADPASQGLTPFKGATTTTAQADGTFDVQAPWPDTAGTPLSSYYVCAIASSTSALSSNLMTIPPNVQLIITPGKVAVGRAFYLTGRNWLPPQPINVSVTSSTPGAPAIIQQLTNSNTAGDFQIKIVVPTTATPGAYSVTATAQNQPTLTDTTANGLTIVSASAPDASGTTTTDGTSTADAQTTTIAGPVATPRTSDDSSSNNNFLIISAIILALILIGGGIALFRYYSTPHRKDGDDPKNPGPPGRPGQPDAFANTNRANYPDPQRQPYPYGNQGNPNGSYPPLNPNQPTYPTQPDQPNFRR